MASLGLAGEAVRDLFGFSLAGLTDAEQRAREASHAAARSQVKGWLRKIKGGDARVLYCAKGKLKAVVRKGLPPEIRPEVWMILSGAKLRKAEAPRGYYAGLAAAVEAGEGPSGVLEVSRDVQRMFRHHEAFRQGDGVRSVRRLLSAFLRHNPEAGYAAGMTAAAAFVLTVMGFHREEDAFWVYASIVEEGLFRGAGEQVSRRREMARCKLLVSRITAPVRIAPMRIDVATSGWLLAGVSALWIQAAANRPSIGPSC
eukprot:evm.model.scf_503.7 EVM.evm.TU.scf_503.7   scf_503:39552-40322(-)